ncbi:MAG: outer membrane beta-barrel protein [Holophagaceae bacterium]|nr:outer membrane beta-barrel protein [Holophagaceae bacterium]
MKLRWIALGLAAPLLAQAPEPGLKDAPSWTVGLGLHAAFASGELSKAVNNHTGYGFAVQFPMRLGGGLMLRPQLEGTGFRVTRYDALAWLYNSDTREVLRTYRAGVDLLIHFTGDPREPGPYLIAGVALQNASFDHLAQDANGDSHTTDTRLSQWGPAWTLGAGLQFNAHVGAELRYYRFDYQDPAALAAAEATRRPGASLLAGLVVRF